MDVRFVPLGGLGEFGMNCCTVECGDDIVVVDAGLMFPDESAPGVDVVIPDLTYLVERKDRIRGVVLTHAHEDHIGALPYLLRDVTATVYGAPLTLALAGLKLAEHEIEADTVAVTPRSAVQLGCLEVEFLQVAHSVCDSLGLVMRSPAGTIVFSGDFKIDPEPFLGQATDLERLASHGDRGVLALFSDSTNAERPGSSQSEAAIIPQLESLFSAAPRKIIVTCFSTSIPRIQHVMTLAARHGRQVAVLGRSLHEVVDVAQRLGYLDIHAGLLVRREDIRSLAPDKVVILATGSQGEPLSVMNRISLRDYPFAEVEENDTVIVSARIIPGSEKAVARVVNRLVRRGARVFHEDIADVHVSGHASREELKTLLATVRPRYFIPVHGEFRQLYAHAQIAREVGLPDSSILIAESGDVVRVGANGAVRDGRVDVGRVFIDGGGAEEVEEAVLHDRRHLSADGFFVIVLVIKKSDGSLAGAPEVISRGFLEMNGNGFAREAQEICEAVIRQGSVDERGDWASVKEKIRRDVRRLLYKRTMKRPIIIPVIVEV